LVQLIIQRLNKKYNKAVATVSREVMQKIRAYAWPGNVRELENVLEGSILFTNGYEMTTLDLELTTEIQSDDGWKSHKQQILARTERPMFESLLLQHQGDIKQAAEQMEISSRAIYQKLKKYDLNITEFPFLKTYQPSLL